MTTAYAPPARPAPPASLLTAKRITIPVRRADAVKAGVTPLVFPGDHVCRSWTSPTGRWRECAHGLVLSPSTPALVTA